MIQTFVAKRIIVLHSLFLVPFYLLCSILSSFRHKLMLGQCWCNLYWCKFIVFNFNWNFMLLIHINTLNRKRVANSVSWSQCCRWVRYCYGWQISISILLLSFIENDQTSKHFNRIDKRKCFNFSLMNANCELWSNNTFYYCLYLYLCVFF